MAKGRRWIRIPVRIFEVVLAIPVAVLAIIGVAQIFNVWFKPNLKAIANGGSWKAPCCVEKELKEIVQVSNPCKKLMEAIEAIEDKAMKAKETKKTTIKAKISDAKDLSRKISGTIKALEPYEANNVGYLGAMYVIDIENNGERASNTLILVTDGVKYVEYEKKSAEGKQQKFEELRDQECRLVAMGELEHKARITAKVWGIDPVSREGCFQIRHEGHDDVPLYMKTPLGRGWVRD